jgi:preprotein translocase subunit SecD
MVRKAAAVSGRDLTNARPSVDQNNLPAVQFTLSGEGARKFGIVTETNIGRRLAIILDNRVTSAPTIQSRITDTGQITGVTRDEVTDLSLILKSGALPATLTYLEERTIGPSLGADSIRSGIQASVVGLLLIVAFMLIYYKLSGVNAIVALLFNLIILIGLMAYIGAVMTLPGIAGFVLTMGIGVDSNVLIFERIKEELEAQHGVRAAINSGPARFAASRTPSSSASRPTCLPRHSCRRRCSSWRSDGSSGRQRRCRSSDGRQACISSTTPITTSSAGGGTQWHCRGS